MTTFGESVAPTTPAQRMTPAHYQAWQAAVTHYSDRTVTDEAIRRSLRDVTFTVVAGPSFRSPYFSGGGSDAYTVACSCGCSFAFMFVLPSASHGPTGWLLARMAYRTARGQEMPGSVLCPAHQELTIRIHPGYFPHRSGSAYGDLGQAVRVRAGLSYALLA